MPETGMLSLQIETLKENNRNIKLLLERLENICISDNFRNSESIAEKLWGEYVKGLDFLQNITDNLCVNRKKNDYGTCPDPVIRFAENISFSIECRYENEHIFCCRISTPPILKKKYSISQFRKTIGLAIKAKASQARIDNPHIPMLNNFFVIYVNNVVTRNAVPPFFDNDNLAIKSILDYLIPTVAVDDSIVFCENLYLTNRIPAGDSFAEIFLVSKSHLLDWCEKHPDIDFAAYLLSMESKSIF